MTSLLRPALSWTSPKYGDASPRVFILQNVLLPFYILYEKGGGQKAREAVNVRILVKACKGLFQASFRVHCGQPD